MIFKLIRLQKLAFRKEKQVVNGKDVKIIKCVFNLKIK